MSAKIEALNTELPDACLYANNANRFTSASNEVTAATDALDAAEMEWLALEEKRDRLSG